MSNNTISNRNRVIIGASTLAAIVIGFSFIGENSEVTIIENPKSSIVHVKPLTIASAWQGETNTLPNADNVDDQLGKQVEISAAKKEWYTMIHQEIGKIRMTEGGDIVIDDITLKALRKAFPSYGLNLTAETLDEIEEIMKKGLPGKAGVQAAEIIRKFYEFSKAKKEMASAYSDINITQGNREEMLVQTKQLRTLYLGDELATKLFDKEDKQTAYMYDTFDIATDKEMTPEQKEEAKRKLSTQYLASLINNWDARYESYQESSNVIKQDQSLNKEDIKEALIDLQKESFTIEELKTIRKANITL